MAKTRLFSTAVEKDYSFLNEMQECAKRVNNQQIFSHIFLGRYKESDVKEFIEDLKIVLARFKKEKRSIIEFADSYNESFATDNNECFTVVLNCFSILKDTLKSSMGIFREFCKKKSHKVIYKEGKSVVLQVHTHSDLGARWTQMLIPFSGKEAIPPILVELSNLIMAFFADIVDVIGVCKEVMVEEVMILKDYPRLKRIYDDTIEELEKFGNVIKYCPDSIDKIEDPMTKEMLQTENEKWDEILCKYFHKKTPAQLLNHHLIFTSFKAKYGFIPTEKEKDMWNNDIDKIKKVRIMISCFDELKPKGQKDKATEKFKLNGKWLAKLMHWAINGYGIEMKDFVDYFNGEYKGIYQKIEYATVVAAYSGMKKEEKDACVIEFENFLNRKAQEEKQKIA